MGFAIAAAAVEVGWTVDLISGPTPLTEPPETILYPVETGEEMYHQVDAVFDACDVLIMTAAVVDFRPKHPGAEGKENGSAQLTLEMEPVVDILKTVTQRKKDQFVVGFAAETRPRSLRPGQTRGKNLDLVVANLVGGAGRICNRRQPPDRPGVRRIPPRPGPPSAEKIARSRFDRTYRNENGRTRELIRPWPRNRKQGLERIFGRLEDLDENNLAILVKRLVRDRHLLESVFDIIRDGILVLDGESVIQYANEAAFRFLGLRRSEIGRSNIWRRVPELSHALEIDPGIGQSGAFHRLVRSRDPLPGNAGPAGLPGAPRGHRANIGEGTVVVFSDVTELKHSTEELIENEKIASIMMLAAGVAHELGNPLNSIQSTCS